MKRSVKMLALLGVLAVLVAGYALASRTQQTSQVSEEAGSFALLGEAEVTGLAWENENGSFRFVKEDGTWIDADDADFPVNQSALSSLAEKAASLTGTREISGVSDAADYGLAAPAFSVDVTAGGGTLTLSMGDETPFGDGYYIGVSGRETIYTVSEALDGMFDKTLTQLCQMEALPDVEHVTRLTVSGALDARLDEAAETWTDARTGEALDAGSVEALIADVQSLTWNSLVSANAPEETMNGYLVSDGLATFVTLYDGETAALTLCFGAQDESGNRYARLEGSQRVYTVYEEDVEALLDAGVETLYAKQPVTAPFDALTLAEFIWDGGAVSVARVPGRDTPEEDEPAQSADAQDDAQTEAETVVLVNGSPDEDGEAQSLWALVTGLEATGRVEETASGTAILTLRCEQGESGSTELSLYSRDVDSYLLPVSDTHGLLIPAEDVDRIIRTLRQM